MRNAGRTTRQQGRLERGEAATGEPTDLGGAGGRGGKRNGGVKGIAQGGQQEARW